MRIIILILSLLVISTQVFAGDDWRIRAFDKDMALTEELWTKEAEIMQKREPKTALFYASWSDFLRTVRDMRTYAFLKRLKEDPAAKWLDEDPIHWVIWSVEERNRLASADPFYRKLLDEYSKKKNVLGDEGVKESKKLRDKIHSEHSELFQPLEDEFMSKSKQLKTDITNSIAESLKR